MAHRPNINNKSNYSDCEISDAKRIHSDRDDCFNNEILIKRHMMAAVDPKINADRAIGTGPVGTKKAITTVPTRIFEISAKYFERVET